VQHAWQGGLINDGSTAAKMCVSSGPGIFRIAYGKTKIRSDPPRFCSFLQEECEKLGVEFLTSANAVQVAQHAGGETTMIDLRLKGGETRRLPCQNLIISAGIWTPKLFSQLFPSVDVGLRLAETQHVQTWLRFSAQTVTDTKEHGPKDTEQCHQVWLSPLDEGDDLHVSSFANGELYVAGELEQVGDDTPPLPDEVRPTPEDVDKLRDLVARYVHLERRQLLSSGKAFMPAVPQGRPIMDRVPPELLISLQRCSKGSDLGVFLSFGHDLDGFTLGLGSGKVVAELVLGEESSIDMSPFRLPLEYLRQGGMGCSVI
jgi:glycine/D-amino acid oxidase-like deaminating enzyme